MSGVVSTGRVFLHQDGDVNCCALVVGLAQLRMTQLRPHSPSGSQMRHLSLWSGTLRLVESEVSSVVCPFKAVRSQHSSALQQQ